MNVFRYSARLFVSVVVIGGLLLGLMPFRPAAAISDCDFQEILSGRAYYNGCLGDELCSQSTEQTVTPTTPGPTEPFTATNLDYAGKPILTKGQLDLITQYAPIYQQAATEYDLPWQILAVVHLRETGLSRSNPKNEQGLFQFFNKAGGPYPPGPVTEQEFIRQTKFMAGKLRSDFLQRNYSPNRNLTIANPSPESIKDMYFSYNGRAGIYERQAERLGFNPNTQGYEGSPYVMNKADANRDPNVNKTTWGQVKRDRGPIEYPANQGHGAFVTYAGLAGIKVSSSGSSAECVATDPVSGGPAFTENTPVREKIVAIAQQELALWASGQLRSGSGYKKYSQNRVERWCADFASWVYNQAGVPLKPGNNGNVPAVQSILTLAITRGRFVGRGNVPRPGDIVIQKQAGASHVNLVISVDAAKGTMVIIGGNQGGNGGGPNASRVSTYSMSITQKQITGFYSAEER